MRRDQLTSRFVIGTESLKLYLVCSTGAMQRLGNKPIALSQSARYLHNFRKSPCWRSGSYSAGAYDFQPQSVFQNLLYR